jgi:hypothetical protein
MKENQEIQESLSAAMKELSDWKVEALIAKAERNKIKVERDSFLAELQKANAIILDLQRNPPKLTEQHLAEIRAEAVESAIKNCAIVTVFQTDTISVRGLLTYAEQIRQGGEK